MEYIPLKSTPSSHKKNDNNLGSALRKQRKVAPTTPRSSYIGSDAKLIPRIKQYLQTCNKRKGINIAAMVNILQQTYSEYRRKKRNAFKIAVIKAYEIICKEKMYNENGSSTKESNLDSSDLEGEDADLGSDFSMDNENYKIYEDANLANNSLRNLYCKKLAMTPRKNNDKSVNLVTSTPLAVEPPKHTSDSVMTQQNMEIQKISLDESILSQKESFVTETPAKTNFPVAKKRKSITESDAAQKMTGKPSKEIVLQQSSSKFSDIGGNEKCIEEVCELLVHLKHPEVYTQLGVPPPRGLLLHGPPGCGKTLLAHAIAGELDLPFIKMAATEIVSGVSGESEEKIRDLFEKAVTAAPCVVFIDEIDAITPKRETAQREMERRIVAQLLICLDDLNSKDISTQVLVIGATNRPDALDPALRRAGRFDREISMGIPDLSARIRILKVLCRHLKLSSDFNFSFIASNSPGYVGADLMALTREAAMCAVKRVFQSLQLRSASEINGKSSLDVSRDEEMRPCTSNQEKPGSDHYPAPCYSSVLSWLHDAPPLTEEQLRNLFIEMSDFQHALKVVQPSAMREGFATVPDVTWDDVGALHEVREELQLSIMAPIRHPEKFKALGLNTPAGILLCGPPGCGKTLLAKAIANESGINFISVKGPELLNMYVGESERAVRQCFQRARNSAPCVIFFDELDALCPKRTDSMEGNASSRVVNQLLTEMDGVEKRRNVFILGASNRPDIIDPAVMRPGRLDKVLFVGLPSAEDRIEILNTLTKRGTRPCLSSDISLTDIGKDPRCNGFTGADLAALIREASVKALKEFMTIDKVCPTCPIVVKKKHFEDAYHRVRLSVSPKELLKYQRMKTLFSSCIRTDAKVMSMEIGETVNTEIMDTTEPDVS